MRESPSRTAPSALLLDAVGTLIGLRHSVGGTYAAVAREHGLAVEQEALDLAFPTVLRQAPPLAFPGLQGPELLAAEQRWWGERIEETFQAVGDAGPAGPLPEQMKLDLFERFAEPDLWQVYPDVTGPMRRWREAGLRLAVVSNFDQRLQRLLSGLGLADLIDVVVVSSAAGAAKPSARPFAIALDSLQLAPHQAWHVGDSPEDVAGAQAAGLVCLRIHRP